MPTTRDAGKPEVDRTPARGSRGCDWQVGFRGPENDIVNPIHHLIDPTKAAAHDSLLEMMFELQITACVLG